MALADSWAFPHLATLPSGSVRILSARLGFRLPTGRERVRNVERWIRSYYVTVDAFQCFPDLFNHFHNSSAQCRAMPGLCIAYAIPKSEWQSLQPPSPLAPGRSAEQASCLSLTAQLASEIFNSLKKFSLREPCQAMSSPSLKPKFQHHKNMTRYKNI